MTGTGQLTGAREIVPVTWQMWLSSMDVSSWGGCRWAWKGSLRPVPADVVSLKQWGLLTGLVALAVWFIFPYLFCLDGRARRWGMYPPEDHGPSSVHLPPIQFLTVLHPVFTYLLVQPSRTLKILTLGRGDSIVLWLWGCEPCRLPWLVCADPDPCIIPALPLPHVALFSFKILVDYIPLQCVPLESQTSVYCAYWLIMRWRVYCFCFGEGEETGESSSHLNRQFTSCW